MPTRPTRSSFTSGATESNNLALRGALTWSRQRGGHLITVATEHNAVLKVAEQLRGEGFRVTILPVDRDGLVDVARVAKCIRAGEPTLVSVMAANNEIGTVQPIAEIGRACRERCALFHCDATQAGARHPARNAQRVRDRRPRCRGRARRRRDGSRGCADRRSS